jgi:hypothetical protein
MICPSALITDGSAPNGEPASAVEASGDLGLVMPDFGSN